MIKEDCIYLYKPVNGFIQICDFYNEIVYLLDCKNCNKYIKCKEGQYKSEK